jgi:DNA primase
MDIKDIKAKLFIVEVLAHYGLKPDRNDRLRCPFHHDKTPPAIRKAQCHC